MKKQRPVFLNLTQIRFPLPAIVSILHRISGVLLFLFIPFVLAALHYSLSSESDFQSLVAFLHEPLPFILTWGFVAALLYHLLAGIRHLLMDKGFAETRSGARKTAWVVIVLAVVLIVLAGIWL
ncbi:MAG TPA: succinate dehydrogenase, cytochrome b556 subunit [Gammaproteobacteria bacterium]|nr:succinate dehydrogenase, cytochrome b556 subunit [Gammaproteobacteria bacterium]